MKKFNKTLRLPTISKIREFYNSSEFKEFKNKVLLLHSNKCKSCSNTKDLGIEYIKDIVYNWNLRLNSSNTKLICNTCLIASKPYVIKGLKATLMPIIQPLTENAS